MGMHHGKDRSHFIPLPIWGDLLLQLCCIVLIRVWSLRRLQLPSVMHFAGRSFWQLWGRFRHHDRNVGQAMASWYHLSVLLAFTLEGADSIAVAGKLPMTCHMPLEMASASCLYDGWQWSPDFLTKKRISSSQTGAKPEKVALNRTEW